MCLNVDQDPSLATLEECLMAFVLISISIGLVFGFMAPNAFALLFFELALSPLILIAAQVGGADLLASIGWTLLALLLVSSGWATSTLSVECWLELKRTREQ